MNSLQRIDSLDFIRGVAVLGILMMNIQSFSMPMAAYSNPTAFGDLNGVNLIAWQFSHLFFDQKFMSIFSILFGVGIAIFSERVTEREGFSGKRHYIRMLWLFLFGALHAIFLWWGDILMMYAVCGCISFLFKDAKDKTLIWVAIGCLSLVWLVFLLQGLIFPLIPLEEIQNDILPMWSPTNDAIFAELAAYNGTYLSAFDYRLNMLPDIQPYLLIFLPRVLSLNLIGFYLYRKRFFLMHWGEQALSKTKLFLVGLLLAVAGIAISWLGVINNFAENFSYLYSMSFGMTYNYWGSVITALGYLCLLMIITSSSRLAWIKTIFSNVGKLAFTNYILQSVLCTSVIYGFGLFGHLERVHQVVFTVVVWVLLLIFSALWLKRFNMGPLEWLWRGLTYFKFKAIGRNR